MKNQNDTAKAIKEILVNLAANDKLPLDMTELNVDVFLPALLESEVKAYVLGFTPDGMTDQAVINFCDAGNGDIYSLEGFACAINSMEINLEYNYVRFI